MGSGEHEKNRLSQDFPFVDQADFGVPAVFGVCPVVAHDEETPIVHNQRKGHSLGIGGGCIGVVLIQRHTVHIDNTASKVNVHSLSFGGDHALDNRLSVVEGILAGDDDIAILGVVIKHAAEYQQPVPIPQCGKHGRPGNHHESEQEDKTEHDDCQQMGQIVQIQQEILLPRSFFLRLRAIG